MPEQTHASLLIFEIMKCTPLHLGSIKKHVLNPSSYYAVSTMHFYAKGRLFINGIVDQDIHTVSNVQQVRQGNLLTSNWDCQIQLQARCCPTRAQGAHSLSSFPSALGREVGEVREDALS